MLINSRQAAIIALLAGLATSGTPASAQPIDWDARFDACSKESTQQDVNRCQRRVMHHKRVDAAFDEQQDDVEIHIDANDQNDGDAQKSAKQAFYDALDECLGHKKQVLIQQCRFKAMRDYSDKTSE